MRHTTLKLLNCSYCGGPFSFARVIEGTSDAMHYGTMACTRCEMEFPVVEGILIARHERETVSVKAPTQDATVVAGPSVRQILDLLYAGRTDEALRVLIVPPTSRCRLPVVHRVLKKSPLRGALRSVETRIGQAVLPRWQRQLVRSLRDGGQAHTAVDLLRHYYGGPFKSEMLNYFRYRFGQPRHLTALCLATLFRQTDGPLLDLACGIGHITHFFTHGCGDRPVVGTDRDFFQLLVARRFVAPGADYLCCDADRPLPLATGAFGGGFCADAFHLFQNPSVCVREIDRVVHAQGVAVYSRFGNALMQPREGYELTLRGYRELFRARRTALLDEQTLLSRYLQQLGPNLDESMPTDYLDGQKGFSAVVSHRDDLFRDHTTMDDWPHAAGRLRLNPLYAPVTGNGKAAGQMNDRTGTNLHRHETEYRFRFPSAWFAYEDQAYRQYAPSTVRLSPDVLNGIRTGERSTEIDDLTKRCVLLGMPEKYL